MEWFKIFNDRQEALQVLNENEPRLLLVKEKRLCLLRRQDQLFVMAEKCPHNGESLTKGSLNYLGEIICPWHGYRFNVVTGRESNERCRDLETFPIRESDDGIFVGL